MCGATSYRPVIARDAVGVMTRTGLYQFSGCSVVFADPKAWREGGNDDVPLVIAPKPHMTTVTPTIPEAPDFKTYGLVPDWPPTTR